MEVLENIAPMLLAVMFTYTASIFAGAGIKRKGDRKIALIGAILILLVSFTIWFPCFDGLYDVIGLNGETKNLAMIISVIAVLLFCVIATLFNAKKEET